MAWYDNWNQAKRLKIVPRQGWSALSYFPVLLNTDSLPTDLVDNTYGRSDGGDLAFATDSGGSIGSQIPCQVVSASFGGGTPSCEIWTQVPSIAANDNTFIWVLYDNPSQTSQPAANTTYGSQYVWKENGTQHFAAVYHLNETGTNPVTYDSTSNSLNSNGGTWTPTSDTQIGRGGAFNGASNYINFANSTIFNNSAITVSAWVHSSDFAQNGHIFEKGTVNTQYSLFFATDRIIWRTKAEGTYNNTAVLLSAADVTNDTWHHIMTSYDGSYKRIYVDGIEVAADPYTTSVYTNTYGQRIGAYGGSSPSYFFNGIIDEVRVSRTGRSASWAAAEYYNQLDPGSFVYVDEAATVVSRLGTARFNVLTELSQAELGSAGLDILIDGDLDLQAYIGGGHVEFTGAGGLQGVFELGTARLNVLTELSQAELGAAGLDILIDTDTSGRYIVIITTQ